MSAEGACAVVDNELVAVAVLDAQRVSHRPGEGELYDRIAVRSCVVELEVGAVSMGARHRQAGIGYVRDRNILVRAKLDSLTVRQKYIAEFERGRANVSTTRGVW